MPSRSVVTRTVSTATEAPAKGRAVVVEATRTVRRPRG